jgi:hypothetical protein
MLFRSEQHPPLASGGESPCVSEWEYRPVRIAAHNSSSSCVLFDLGPCSKNWGHVIPPSA